MKPQKIDLFTTTLILQEQLTFTGSIDSFVEIKQAPPPPPTQEQKPIGDLHAIYIIDLCKGSKGDSELITSICERYLYGKHNEKTRANIFSLIWKNEKPTKRATSYKAICDLLHEFFG